MTVIWFNDKNARADNKYKSDGDDRIIWTIWSSMTIAAAGQVSMTIVFGIFTSSPCMRAVFISCLDCTSDTRNSSLSADNVLDRM